MSNYYWSRRLRFTIEFWFNVLSFVSSMPVLTSSLFDKKILLWISFLTLNLVSRLFFCRYLIFHQNEIDWKNYFFAVFVSYMFVLIPNWNSLSHHYLSSLAATKQRWAIDNSFSNSFTFSCWIFNNFDEFYFI